ncbi:group II intron reverse transcriptase/maturase [Alkalispirochaeta alkalica]|uniref:group II intron reverse transcriptase/maturase n=1 Tax=Alkalispirochaeta alkalica TaxID=46356 RepID=UPI00035D877D|nr:group II intron reverse transcriptase/maturase [Alkalispirochaeta alkalica]
MGKTKPFDIPKRTIWEAYKRVRKNGGAPGIDGQNLEGFEAKLSDNLYKLWNRMSSGSYIPEAVRRVDIPKSSGGTRPLGIPTVVDRIAQMAARLTIEPALDAVFHEDSYGHRARKSAHQALARARKRCWRYDWVVDLDIKGFFDTIDHELMMKAVRHHAPPKWVELYIDRWLKAPVRTTEGALEERGRGTPQGGVISPLLANLYLHYAFDMWMVREHSEVPFERSADDIVLHCRTQEQAEELREEITRRLAGCKLTAHPEKTKVVYCRDGKRREDYERTEFDFLGYTFRPRMARSHDGSYFLNFTPGVSRKAKQAMKAEMRSWKAYRKVSGELEDLSQIFNAKLRGWEIYYGKFRRSEMYEIYRMFQRILVKWARSKYKRVKRSWKKAAELLRKMALARPYLFEHWTRGCYAIGRVRRAV